MTDHMKNQTSVRMVDGMFITRHVIAQFNSLGLLVRTKELIISALDGLSPGSGVYVKVSPVG